MKKILIAVAMTILFGFTTVGLFNVSNRMLNLAPVQRTQNVDGDIEMLDDGSIIISGGVDEDTYKEFLRFTSTGKRHYTIRLMTNGGCAYNTIAIMSRMEQLQKQGVKFTTIVMGNAFSAGAYIFMMGDERIMGPGANLMWHTMTGAVEATGREVPKDRVKLISDMDHWVVGMFEKRFPYITKVWIKEAFWYTNYTWMNAIEARLMGIATKVLD